MIGLELLGKFALFRSLAVLVRFPGQGNASQLTKQVEESARSRQVEALNLLTMTAEDFFAKRGYHRVDRDTFLEAVQETAEFQSLCPSIAVCMHKYLNADENFDSKR